MSIVVSNQPAIAPFDRDTVDPNLSFRSEEAHFEAPTAEEIAAVAYATFERRGGEHGRDVEDWLEAEQQLRRSR
jgi:Protein of unknown function (DUF2934)